MNPAESGAPNKERTAKKGGNVIWFLYCSRFFIQLAFHVELACLSHFRYCIFVTKIIMRYNMNFKILGQQLGRPSGLFSLTRDGRAGPPALGLALAADFRLHVLGL
jgi:hypothetical protein